MLKAFGFTLLLLAAPSVGWTRCGDLPSDATAVADARAAIAATCSCSALPTHGVYVACARGIVAQRIAAGLLSGSCGASVKRCAFNSTCGRAGAVACCTTHGGKTHCNIKQSAGLCRAPRGGSACASVQASCCDACAQGGCASPTPTASPTPSPTPGPTLSFVPCSGGSGAPLCDGTCPAGSACSRVFLPDFSDDCACLPTGTTFCGMSGSGFPSCGGSCFDGRVCQAGKFVNGNTGSVIDLCTCVDPATPCGPTCPADGFGFCGNGLTCEAFVIGGGAECGCIP